MITYTWDTLFLQGSGICRNGSQLYLKQSRMLKHPLHSSRCCGVYFGEDIAYEEKMYSFHCSEHASRSYDWLQLLCMFLVHVYKHASCLVVPAVEITASGRYDSPVMDK